MHNLLPFDIEAFNEFFFFYLKAVLKRLKFIKTIQVYLFEHHDHQRKKIDKVTLKVLKMYSLTMIEQNKTE